MKEQCDRYSIKCGNERTSNTIERKTIMNTGKILTGIAVAAAAGVLVGMLFAPEKGIVTRRRLSRKGNGVVDDVNDSFSEFSDALTDGFESIRKSADDLVEKGKARSSAWSKNSK